ncbi:hypothetical protein QBC47DRAFT_159297 [Echria macrotheca]|uniref:Uncharacterized protein n=1 Tax=Echria macrotheca TaxID=438768 RepID=A0AAJ0BI11_9PEZI|nr:hypothetical protein QBC47DRAFT_159297 [Echria macrotheca]
MAAISGTAAAKQTSDSGSVAPFRPVKVTPVPVPVPGLASSQPLSGSRSSTGTKSQTAGGPVTTTPTTTTTPSTAFGVLASTDANLQDATNGFYRDGRIRNPVPSKLKGKTDGSKGNFSVLHLEVVGREATEREGQAKRTSESTELAAKRAFENGYISLRRSRFVHVPDETAAKPEIPVPTPVRVSNPTSRQSPLSPEETKSEQARLLTLLRSLHPVLIVDQICKALAFFGGIPGAPPPADGVFPQSAEANGSGSLFVGWVSEIFPKLGGNGSQQEVSEPSLQFNPPEVKRRRGRPKGSKSSKVRKDKGIKKGPSKAASTAAQAPVADAEESWVDVDEPTMGVTDDVDANVMLLAQAGSPNRPQITNPNQEISQEVTADGEYNQATAGSARTALPGGNAGLDVTADNSSSAKKRGRPKGSKNRPKDSTAASTENAASSQQASQGLEPGQTNTAPQVQPIYQQSQQEEPDESPTVVRSAIPTIAKKKTSKARAPPLKRNPRDQQNSAAATAVQTSEAVNNSHSTLAEASSSRGNQPASQPGSQLGQQDGYRQQTLLQAAPIQHDQPPAAPSPGQGKAAGSSAQKRKRKTGKDTENTSTSSHSQGNDRPSTLGQAAITPTASVDNVSASRPQPSFSAVGPPPAKRQRKGKMDSKQGAPPKQNDYPTGSMVATNVPTNTTSAVVNSPPIPTSATADSLSASAATIRRGQEPATSLPAQPVQHSLTSVPSPHHGHFEVQSPTMENYEAQLQAQLEQQAEHESQPPQPSQPVSAQGRMASSRLIPGHLQQPKQQKQQSHGQPSATQSISPNPQPPPPLKSQTASPVAAQQQTRTPQPPSYSQYRPSNTPFGQQHQQNYGATQHQQGHQQRFTGPSQAAQPQQYSPNAQQPFSSNQQYNSTHQQLGSQQRYQQQLATSSAAATSTYAAQHSPQFGSSTNSAFGATDGTYRGSANNLSTGQYASRSQSGTPTATYRGGSANTGSHTLSQHSSSFGTDSSGGQQRPASTTHSQGIMAGVSSFPSNSANDWGIFDASSLDASSAQNSLSLNSNNYGMTAASVRAPPNTSAGFTSNTLGNFDASSLGNNDRFYGVGRR